jgi:uncharacterized membrane protein YkvA (DUF1232 family)
LHEAANEGPLSETAMKFKETASSAGWFELQMNKWKRDVAFILWKARTLSTALRHPLVPSRAKLAAALGVGYIFSPIQLIPTFIPVIGQLDDLCVLYVAMKLLRKWTPLEVMAECESRAGRELMIERRREAGNAELARTFDDRYPATGN